MRSARFGLLLFFLVLIVPLRAQQVQPSNPTMVDDKQAITGLQSSLSVLMGSAKALPSSLVASGNTTQFSSDKATSYPVRIRARDADKFRWEADLPGGTTATVINGQKAQLQLASTTNSLIAWEVGGKKIENFPILLLARWLNTEGIQAQFVGQETIDGQALIHISIVDLSQRLLPLNPSHRDQNRGQYELYIDPVTSFSVRLRYYQETDDTHFFSLVPVDLVYSDFRVAAGFVFPYMLTRYIGTTKIAVLQLQSIQPDGAVSDQDFEVN